MPVEILVKMILAGNSNSFLRCKYLHLRIGSTRKDASPSTDTIEKVKPTVIDLAYWLADSLDAGHDNATMYYAWDEKAQNLRMRKKSDAYHYQLSLGRYKKQIPKQCPVMLGSTFFLIWISFSFAIKRVHTLLLLGCLFNIR